MRDPPPGSCILCGLQHHNNKMAQSFSLYATVLECMAKDMNPSKEEKYSLSQMCCEQYVLKFFFLMLSLPRA